MNIKTWKPYALLLTVTTKVQAWLTNDFKNWKRGTLKINSFIYYTAIGLPELLSNFEPLNFKQFPWNDNINKFRLRFIVVIVIHL